MDRVPRDVDPAHLTCGVLGKPHRRWGTHYDPGRGTLRGGDRDLGEAARADLEVADLVGSRCGCSLSVRSARILWTMSSNLRRRLSSSRL